MPARPKKRQIAVILAALLAIVLLCDLIVLRYHAKARYTELKAGAKTVSLYAEEWLNAGYSSEELSGEGQITAQSGGFGAYLAAEESPYLHQGYHYAVVCDPQGQVQKVLYSRNTISDRDPEPDLFTAVRKLQTPVIWRYTIVCYP